jgi:hypothetical protein
VTYRPPRPTDAQRVVWPEDFGTRFTVFVDVEEEFDWTAPSIAATARPPRWRPFPTRIAGSPTAASR